MIIALCLLVLSLGAVLYTFVQPRYEAVIVRVDKTTTVTSHASKHGSRSYPVAYLTVNYTDRSGVSRTAQAKYSRPQGPLSRGQRLTLVDGADGLIVYPWSGLRTFGVVIALMAGLFLLSMRLGGKPGKAAVQDGEQAGQADPGEEQRSIPDNAPGE